MNTTTPSPDADASASQTVLDETKRRLILALVAHGCSRRTAARYVGCNVSSITRLAARDPEFAGRLATARENPQIECLRAIRTAACERHQWRAAAWILEHKYSADYVSGSAGVHPSHHLLDLLRLVATEKLTSLSVLDRQIVSGWFDEFMATVCERMGAPRRARVQHSVAQSPKRAKRSVNRNRCEDEDCDEDS